MIDFETVSDCTTSRSRSETSPAPEAAATRPGRRPWRRTPRSRRRPRSCSDGVSVDATSGALDTTIPLPSYNPNVPAVALTYDSLTADPRADHCRGTYLRPHAGGPVAGQRQLTFDSSWGHDLLLQHQPVQPGRRPADRPPGQRHLALDRPVRLLRPVVDYARPTRRRRSAARPRSSTSRRAPSATAGRSQGLEQIISASRRRDPRPGRRRQEPLVHRQLRQRRRDYTDPAGSSRRWSRTEAAAIPTPFTDGTQITFNSGGYETATSIPTVCTSRTRTTGRISSPRSPIRTLMSRPSAIAAVTSRPLRTRRVG